MSHLTERPEKNCLNCNAQLSGKFCHICGQENIEPKESAWHLVSHFLQDITHFDGKFFRTTGLLIRKPGFLPQRYMEGHRAGYLNPVRMYVFTSAFFFLIFFTVFSLENLREGNTLKINGVTLDKINEMDSIKFADFTRGIKKKAQGVDQPMSREEFRHFADTLPKQLIAQTHINTKYKTRSAYDSALTSGAEKDNWLERQFIYKMIGVSSKYGKNGGEFGVELSKSILHRLPQLLFVSLPLFALLLKLLYFRRKKFYYVDHAVFSIHFYIFVFISMLVSFGLDKLNARLHWGALDVVSGLVIAANFFYLYKAMRYFYSQRRGKTILKFLLLNLLSMLLMLVLFTFFILFSFFTI